LRFDNARDLHFCVREIFLTIKGVSMPLRTPTNILKLKGSLRHDKARHANRVNEPQPTEAIDEKPPPWMNAEQKETYRYLVATAPANVLSRADGFIVQVVAVLLAEFRSDPENFSAAKHSLLLTGLGHLGMTPTHRSKVTAMKQPTKSKFQRMS
jgi:phage terminase small subunit